MKKTAVLICILLFACVAGFGQQTAKDQKIEKLLVSMNIDKQVDSIFTQVKAVVAAQLPASATEEQKARFNEMEGKMFDLMQSQLSWEKMKPQYIKLYSDTYSDEEIDGLSAFYNTPTGKAVLAKMPGLTAKSIVLAQDVVRRIMPQIQQMTKDALTTKSGTAQ